MLFRHRLSLHELAAPPPRLELVPPAEGLEDEVVHHLLTAAQVPRIHRAHTRLHRVDACRVCRDALQKRHEIAGQVGISGHVEGEGRPVDHVGVRQGAAVDAEEDGDGARGHHLGQPVRRVLPPRGQQRERRVHQIVVVVRRVQLLEPRAALRHGCRVVARRRWRPVRIGCCGIHVGVRALGALIPSNDDHAALLVVVQHRHLARALLRRQAALEREQPPALVCARVREQRKQTLAGGLAGQGDGHVEPGDEARDSGVRRGERRAPKVGVPLARQDPAVGCVAQHESEAVLAPEWELTHRSQLLAAAAAQLPKESAGAACPVRDQRAAPRVELRVLDAPVERRWHVAAREHIHAEWALAACAVEARLLGAVERDGRALGAVRHVSFEDSLVEAHNAREARPEARALSSDA
mmetsp:Transcript_4593/g.11839  ORF Transcript_4593/g.11839 Transcript_4593/m.11839 type:complete len:410 (-) Transcript_4593:207-1436(-)